MASVKNLKKDINYTLGDIIEECYMWELENPGVDTVASQGIIDEAIAAFDELLDKVNAKDVESKKAHFKGISTELEEKAKALIAKVNAL
ncbi:hypothetical protein [uncultured Tenacibaculum sp.]|uniref:hypothetical protein n=1 Tax=uncultured Tenacibaculum sp. TaxID=174713 RepID=UPI002636F9C0|nr:hypothetical protein [uncultured Tenacibaculum sp.]